MVHGCRMVSGGSVGSTEGPGFRRVVPSMRPTAPDSPRHVGQHLQRANAHAGAQELRRGLRSSGCWHGSPARGLWRCPSSEITASCAWMRRPLSRLVVMRRDQRKEDKVP
jgi:hypothetical protein